MSRYPLVEYTTYYAPFEMNFAMYTITSGFAITFLLLATLTTQLYHCCFKNRDRYVAQPTDPEDRRLLQQHPASWEKESHLKPASSFTLLLLAMFSFKMT